MRQKRSWMRSSAGRMLITWGGCSRMASATSMAWCPAAVSVISLRRRSLGVRLALDKAVNLQLVDDEGGVRGVDAVCVSQLAEGHRSVSEPENDFASPAAGAKSQRFTELASAGVGLDEPAA